MTKFIVVNAESSEAKAFCMAAESWRKGCVCLKVDESYGDELDCDTLGCNNVEEAMLAISPSMVVDFSVQEKDVNANKATYDYEGVFAVFPLEEGFCREAERVLCAKNIEQCKGLHTIMMSKLNSSTKEKLGFLNNFMSVLNLA